MSEQSARKRVIDLLKLQRAESNYVNAIHYRDSQESEYKGAVAARNNGTDYYEDHDDFMNDLARRLVAWQHWQDKMEQVKAEIFRLSLATGKKSEYLG